MDMRVNKSGSYHAVSRRVGAVFNPKNAPVFNKNFTRKKFSRDNIGDNSLD
jgi:hypothetical protein